MRRSVAVASTVPLDPESRALRGGKDGTPTPATSNAAALYRLMAWLSPAYPVGAFSYSSGIEWAVEAGDITDAATLRRWLAVMIGEGGGFCDAVFFVHAHRAATASDDAALRAVAELAAAFAPVEGAASGNDRAGPRLFETTRAAWPCAALDRLTAVWDGADRLSGRGRRGVRRAWHCRSSRRCTPICTPSTANLISAGVRLIPLGQTDGQRVLAALEPVVTATAARALVTPLDEVGGAAFRADLASMRHETQYTRLFRS